MAGVSNQEFMGENGPLNPPHHLQDGLEASVTPEGSATHAQVTPLDVQPLQQEIPVQEDPLVVPQVPQGAPMEVVMAALVNTINRQGQLLREQTANMRGKNELIHEQNRRIQAVENSRAASRISRSIRRRRSPTPENNRSRSRISEKQPLPTTEERSYTSTKEQPLASTEEQSFASQKEQPFTTPEKRWSHEKPPSLDKYDGTTDPDEHIQSVETALDYRNLRGSIDSWDELCRLFKAHFTTSKRHPKTVANLKAIVQGPEEPLRSYIERFNKVVVEVADPTDKMNLYLLKDGLREGTKFQEAVGIVEMESLDELAQQYIRWEEKQKASKVRRPKNQEAGPSSQREERQGDEKRREGGKAREAKPPKSQFTHYTHLNAPRDMILAEISNAEFKSAGIRFPKQLPAKPNVDKKKFCRLHKSYGHVTEDCVHLKDAIEILIQKGYARQYENFPGALVISGGGFNPITIGSIKRKFDELEKASAVAEIKITEVKESSIPLAFYREEVPEGSPNFQIPLLVRAKMSNFDVIRILVDQGNSCDIMYSGLFKVLQLTEENLVPYVGSDLQGFNAATTKPWGYVDLIVTFGEDQAMKSVKVKFLVVDCPSLYNCIIGRRTLAELFAISSTIHLKMKYYTKNGQVATINGDIDAARRCFEAAAKNLNTVATPQKKKKEVKLPGIKSVSTEDAVELDARTSKKERKQEKNAMNDNLLVKEDYRPIPDGEFELVPLGDDPTKGIKIGADLPDLVKRQLKACLRENAELFAWSAAKKVFASMVSRHPS
ncbi:hypothetical protein TSUD_178190 [Trifolium subterraneum]|uniref:Retrotransposon gag domain-containing protein n=1 Tax=Trifolium subterraneum TaxID=3900 RepID=A0A2Z6M5D7_TRISU|nr:hypothetical protein TSUD_178190 [Trifolium subterraneum]